MQQEIITTPATAISVNTEQTQVETTIAPQPIIQHKVMNYYSTYENLINNASTIKDYIKFAEFLDFNRFVWLSKESVQTSEDYVYYELMPCFCSTKIINSESRRDYPTRLGQAYARSLWLDSCGYTHLNLQNPESSIYDACSRCNFYGGEDHPLCPYKLCAFIQAVASSENLPTSSIYQKLLGSDYIDFRYQKDIQITEDAIVPYIQDIDSKTARAAGILMMNNLFHVSSIASDKVEYSYVPLHFSTDKSSFVSRIISFWNTKTDCYGYINPGIEGDIFSAPTARSGCEFKQHPDKIAAYITWLANAFSVDPVDLAFYISSFTTISKLNEHEHYQYVRFCETVKTLPMVKESYEEYTKVLRYIINRSQRKMVPYIQQNFVIHTSDESLASSVTSCIHNAFWYFDYFQNNKNTALKNVSMVDTSIPDLISMYRNEASGTIFSITGFTLSSSETNRQDMIQLTNVMRNRKDVTTIISGDKSILNAYFSDYPDLYRSVLNHHLYFTDMSEDSVYQVLIDKLDSTFELTEEFKSAASQYIDTAYSSHELKSHAFINSVHDQIVFNHFNNDLNVSFTLSPKDLPFVKPRRSEAEIYAELDSMVGLSSVKSTLHDVSDLVKFKGKTNQDEKQRSSMHMVFSGNAGTGKTTVAKLVAEILYNIGFIQQNKLVVCSGKDLIGKFLGQTQHITAQKCEQAYGGVLFIDEAYLLNPYTSGNGTSDTYKQDCVNELLQQMENNRDRLVVIFAGYTKEMDDFITNANPGLKSRITKNIEFPDYSLDELITIFTNIVKANNMHISESALMRVRDLTWKAMQDSSSFGNARFARSLFEKAEMQHARNTRDLESGNPALYELTAEDIVS